MLFSLICTVYNREQYLAQAIESALKQTHQSWELIVWDDGSTDSSKAIARSFADKDGRIYAGGTNANNGRAMALRNAIYASQGKWIGLLDSDDALTPDALTMAATYAEDPRCGLIYTDRTLIDAVGKPLKHQGSPTPEQVRGYDLCGKVPFHLQLYRRDLFDRTCGVDTTLKAAIDYDLALKMLELPDCGMTQINQPLYLHRIHPDRISTDIDTQTFNALVATRKAIDRRGLHLQADLMWQLKEVSSNPLAPKQ
jgi:glycosyltransferase involved in cell wall biosynthesis